jgi:hypothetical protein
VFYADPVHLAGQPHRTRGHTHRIQRRAAPGSPRRHARPPAGRARPVTNVRQGRCCGCHPRACPIGTLLYWRATGASQPLNRWTAHDSELLEHGCAGRGHKPLFCSPLPRWEWQAAQLLNPRVITETRDTVQADVFGSCGFAQALLASSCRRTYCRMPPCR